MVAPTVAHLSFVRDDGQPLDYIPGQFLQVHFATPTAPTKRSYSLATQHDDPLACPAKRWRSR
jgi:ferredoxin-NADP reductase